MRPMHTMQKKTRTPRKEESCQDESDFTTPVKRGMDELASVVEELERTLDVQDVEDL